MNGVAQKPDTASTRRKLILPRWVLLLLVMIVWPLLVFLFHGLLPWVLSGTARRLGWAEHGPSYCNWAGLGLVGLGVIGFLWFWFVHTRRVSTLKTVELKSELRCWISVALLGLGIFLTINPGRCPGLSSVGLTALPCVSRVTPPLTQTFVRGFARPIRMTDWKLMKRILLVLNLAVTLVVSSPCGHGQTVVEAWVQRYHEAESNENRPLAIAVDSSGNAIVTGSSTDTNAFDFKHWVTIAYSSLGAPLWTNRFHGPGDFYDDQPNAVAVDAQGNAFVAGVSFGDGGNQDYVTIKYSSAGVGLWTNRYNGPGNGNDGANAVTVDGGGNVIVTGLSVGLDGLSSFFDYATVKYSNAGVPLWTNRYNGPANNEDQATGVVVDGSGNVFVTGISYAINGRADFATVGYSGAGVPLWTNRYNGPADSDDNARAVAVDSSGNVFVTGESWNGSATDYATIKYSAAGVPLWTNRYHTPGSGNNFARGMATDGNGNVFVTGSGGGFATIKYSNAGLPLWTNRYNGPSGFSSFDTARAIAVDGGGNVIVTGDSYRDFVTRDIATIAYSNAGVPLWTNRYNGPANGDDVPLTKQSLALGPSGNVYVAAASDGDFLDVTIFGFVTIKYMNTGSVPSLTIARSNSFAVLSWPSAFGNYQLQENTNVSLAIGWSAVPQTAVTNGGQISVTVPVSTGANYFRLKPE
jgi:hypothetical protein